MKVVEQKRLTVHVPGRTALDVVNGLATWLNIDGNYKRDYEITNIFYSRIRNITEITLQEIADDQR